MKKADFSIAVDVRHSVVRITMSGFFEAEDIARFMHARDVAQS